jgi:AcrR family transcriptional regulator
VKRSIVAKDVKDRASKEVEIENSALKLFLRHGFRKVRMGDIAEACKISRPSLYAVFPNKETIFASIVHRYTRKNLALTEKALKTQTDSKARLECIFEVWVIEAYALAITSENAAELSRCAPTFAPEATALTWKTVECQIAETLRAESKKKRDPAVTELAHVLALAAKAAKSASESLPELRRLVQGLIGMTLASLEKLNS